MPTVNEIINSLDAMDHKDVRRINQAAYEILRRVRSAETRAAKSKLRVGDKVTWSGRYGFQSGTIKKVNRTRCVVDTGEYRNWTVPMTMLTVV